MEPSACEELCRTAPSTAENCSLAGPARRCHRLLDDSDARLGLAFESPISPEAAVTRLNSGLSEGAFQRLNSGARLKATSPSTIVRGCHYITADYGFLPLPGIGTVPFKGEAIGPGNTDTVYRRLEDIELRRLEISETIPIELIALSVRSIDPVTIGGDQFDMHIRLTEGARSMGELSVMQERLDDGSGIPNGIFHKNININFTCHFAPVGVAREAPELAVSASVYIATIRPGTWSLNAWPGAVVVRDEPRQTTNFFVTSSIYMHTNSIGDGVGSGGSKRGASV